MRLSFDLDLGDSSTIPRQHTDGTRCLAAMVPTIEIDKRGDVLLQLGPEDAPVVNLRVSSKVLGLSSPVFEAMFNHGFAEGEGLSSSSPRAIPMPGDDVHDMTVLSNIIHLQNVDVPSEFSLVQLAQFAVLVDKYACVDSVRLWSQAWLRQLLKKVENPDYESLLFSCYVLDLPLEFYKVTQSIVGYRVDPINVETATQGHEFLPLHIINRLERYRQQLQEQMMQVIYSATMVQDARTCCYAGIQAVRYLQALQDIQMWPPQSMTLKSLHIGAHQLLQTTYQGHVCPLGLSNNCFCSSNSKIQADIYPAVKSIFDSVAGFCLDCVIKKDTGGHFDCRVPHDENGRLST